ncbi:hypothetical protein B0T26DRAFT_645403 [Lasiosphaeria miniovina]|uniref:Uncharacterized protein n=1 Tax=Lasiosphaeria miniovina TaxID=1954250 RepID=A0AA40AKL1_9PEZI|nr:uncharacterized protein B0T26DRAFT_645403 [Lasiosphaeria miniovina]KAK0717539.1 hypothetical protein B0T26DRAFT_645403 [Lasiosphaeria miniovina]
MIGPQKVYSLYCIRHTCDKTLPDNEGYHCPLPRLADQRYCADHIRCGTPRCREKGQNDDGTWPWFCQTHRCTKSPCLDGIDNLLQQRCKKHTDCAAPQCTNYPATNLHSTFCSRHTCEVDACPLQAVETNLCAEHLRKGKQYSSCSTPGCRRPRKESRRFCSAHACVIPNCADDRDPSGGSLCSMHRCTLNDCSRPIADLDRADSLFCTVHGCKCRSADCGNEASFENGFCSAKHACVVPLCPKVRMLAGPTSPAASASGELPERCYDHQIVWVQTTVRRAVSEELQADFKQERAKWERDKKRLSDDLSEMKRREREWQEYLRGERDMRKRRASNEAHPEPDRLHPEYRGNRNYHGGSE